ncbi:MAG: hypothetical protein O2999_04300 [Nitrospirae bacterium]|nr:hypothetical protein [Nitrospirota bacterium]MDA1303510.1 hypothetical protein [Nitrospirota bacterium]
MNTAKEVRDDIRDKLSNIVSVVNAALKGKKALIELKPTVERLGRRGKLPHWYETLERDGTLPNLDGKSLGSVLEMVFVAALECKFYYKSPLIPFRVNPARGIDIPDLQLGVKSPSENYCTSEPFFSAYERLLGNEHDAVILLTDYQSRKKSPPLRIQIIKQSYLTGSQIADMNLCVIAKIYRKRLRENNISELKKIVRFLAYINQSDWEAKSLLNLLSGKTDDAFIEKSIDKLAVAFEKTNAKREKEGKELISQSSLDRLQAILGLSPRWMGIVNAADTWVIETQKDAGRYPNDSEWERFLRSPLDGLIGMSLALQWRYNFGPLFRERKGPKKTG